MKKIKGLSPYEKEVVKRIRILIDDYCDGSQKKFVDKTGLNKGSVSQYVNGKNIPSWENAEKIAAAFKIDVQWLMAVDILPHPDDYIVIPPGVDVEPSPEAYILFEKFRAADPATQEVIKRLLKDF